MNEYNEILTHIPLQYTPLNHDTKICVIEKNDDIYKEIKKYNIKDITRIKDKPNLLKNLLQILDEKFNLIICDNNYNLTNDIINKLINICDILVIPDKITTNYIWSYFNWFNINQDEIDEITCNYKIKVNKNINFYSNKINPVNYFVSFNEFNRLKVNTQFYNPENHFKYFMDNKINDTKKIIFGAHIMLDFDNVDYDLLENIEYIKNMMNDIAVTEKFIVLDKVYHKFEPQGFTMLFLLSTSHFSIHTYPEYNKCSIDLYSCDMNVDYNNVIDKLKKGLKSDSFRLHQIIRKI